MKNKNYLGEARTGDYANAGIGKKKCFVITTVNQLSTAKNKFQAAKRLGNMTG